MQVTLCSLVPRPSVQLVSEPDLHILEGLVPRLQYSTRIQYHTEGLGNYFLSSIIESTVTGEIINIREN